jgi:hypothetical protein
MATISRLRVGLILFAALMVPEIVFAQTTVLPGTIPTEPQPGVYRLAARPAFGNWAGGIYVVLMTVTRRASGGMSILAPLDIPF